MDAQSLKNPLHKSAFKPNQHQSSKQFKPIISIPIITVQPKQSKQFSEQQTQKQRNTDQSQTLTQELRAKKLFQEYLQCVRENKMLKTTIQHVNKQKLELQDRYNTLQIREKNQSQNKKKRHRRNANQIVRSYQCPVDNCDKSYGAEASLTQHIKLKHQKFYSTPQYQRFIIDLNKKSRDGSSQQED